MATWSWAAGVPRELCMPVRARGMVCLQFLEELSKLWDELFGLPLKVPREWQSDTLVV